MTQQGRTWERVGQSLKHVQQPQRQKVFHRHEHFHKGTECPPPSPILYRNKLVNVESHNDKAVETSVFTPIPVSPSGRFVQYTKILSCKNFHWLDKVAI